MAEEKQVLHAGIGSCQAEIACSLDIDGGNVSRPTPVRGGSQVNYNSWSPSITANGGFVAFASYAPNLVPDDTNNETDIFVHERGLAQEVFLPIIQ